MPPRGVLLLLFPGPEPGVRLFSLGGLVGVWKGGLKGADCGFGMNCMDGRGCCGCGCGCGGGCGWVGAGRGGKSWNTGGFRRGLGGLGRALFDAGFAAACEGGGGAMVRSSSTRRRTFSPTAVSNSI